MIKWNKPAITNSVRVQHRGHIGWYEEAQVTLYRLVESGKEWGMLSWAIRIKTDICWVCWQPTAHSWDHIRGLPLAKGSFLAQMYTSFPWAIQYSVEEFEDLSSLRQAPAITTFCRIIWGLWHSGIIVQFVPNPAFLTLSGFWSWELFLVSLHKQISISECIYLGTWPETEGMVMEEN